MDNLSPKVFIVILNWNGWRDTVKCLESLQKLNYPDYCIVVVDNDSSDGSQEHIKAWADVQKHYQLVRDTSHTEPGHATITGPTEDEGEAGGADAGELTLVAADYDRFVLVQSGVNHGFAHGCNLGIRYALQQGAEYVWLLNNDTLVEPNALRAMVDTGMRDPDVGVVGSVLRYYDEPGRIQAYGGGRLNLWTGSSRHFIAPVADSALCYVSGASMMIKKSVIIDVGLFDESYFFYWEDIDYCHRALRRGWTLAVSEGSHVLHREGGTVSRGEAIKSLVSDEFDTRGMILFLRKHARFRWAVAVLLRLCGMVVNRLRRGQWCRILPLLRLAWATVLEVRGGRQERA